MNIDAWKKVIDGVAGLILGGLAAAALIAGEILKTSSFTELAITSGSVVGLLSGMAIALLKPIAHIRWMIGVIVIVLNAIVCWWCIYKFNQIVSTGELYDKLQRDLSFLALLLFGTLFYLSTSLATLLELVVAPQGRDGE